MSDQDTFEQGDAGKSFVTQIAAGSVKKGGYCMLKGFPCKVTDYSTSKAGKHGHAKASIAGNDIFTGKRIEDSAPTSHNIDIPVVIKTEFQVINIEEDGFVSLMTDKGETKEDIKLPEDQDSAELTKEVKESFEADKEVYVTIQAAMGKEKIVTTRNKE